MENKIIIKEEIRKELSALVKAEAAHYKAIEQLSLAAGDVNIRLWGLICEDHPELKGKRTSLNTETWEVTLREAEG